MRPSSRRLLFLGLFTVAAALGAWAYWLSLVPATHADHDHGILNLDAGGRLMAVARDGTKRNLVGRPGHVLVIHFFSTGSAPDAAAELAELFAVQARLKDDRGVEFLILAREPDFATLDAWLKEKNLALPVPASLYLDPTGDTTQKLNSKRPLETMIFNPEGKLSSQARGRMDWGTAEARINSARGGETIE
jgi:AhpC/TSA family